MGAWRVGQRCSSSSVQTHVFLLVFLVLGVSVLVRLVLGFHGFGESFHVCDNGKYLFNDLFFFLNPETNRLRDRSPPLFAASTASAGRPNWFIRGPNCPDARALLNMLIACRSKDNRRQQGAHRLMERNNCGQTCIYSRSPGEGSKTRFRLFINS